MANGVSSFHGIVNSRPSRFKNKIYTKALHYDLILKSIKGIPSGEAGIYLNTYATALGIPFEPPLSYSECCDTFSNLAALSFVMSNPLEGNSGRSCVGLGPMAIDLVISLTGYIPCHDDEVCQQLIECLPILGAYSSIEETYLTLIRKSMTLSD